MTMTNGKTETEMNGATIQVPASTFEAMMKMAFEGQQAEIQGLKAQLAAVKNGIVTIIPANPAKTSGRAGYHQAQPQVDSLTNVYYRTKAEAGLKVCTELGISRFQLDKAGKQVLDEKGQPKINNYVWYEVIKKDSARFRPATAQEIEAHDKVKTVTQPNAEQPTNTTTVTPPAELNPGFMPDDVDQT